MLMYSHQENVNEQHMGTNNNNKFTQKKNFNILRLRHCLINGHLLVCVMDQYRDQSVHTDVKNGHDGRVHIQM